LRGIKKKKEKKDRRMEKKFRKREKSEILAYAQGLKLFFSLQIVRQLEENLINRAQSFPWGETGRPTTKSRLRTDNGTSGQGNGERSPYGLALRVYPRRHDGQALT
jgi:hypothetical protein